MISSDNEQKETDSNINKNQSLLELTQLTHFSPEQIENFQQYFRDCKMKLSKYNSDEKYNSQIDVLTQEEFKISLGVLSTKSCGYICDRLFEVVTGEGKQFLSFREYILYLDLVNYGSGEDKLKHCFKFFDIGKKGYITNKDFTTIILNLSIFLSNLTISQMLINENELSLFYDYYLSKENIKILDLEHFEQLLTDYPSFLDFYDIFNNKIFYEMNFFIRREEMDKLIEIKNKIFELKNIFNQSQVKTSSVSLVTEEYIDDIIEERKDFCNISSIASENNVIDSTFENNLVNDLLSLEGKNKKNISNYKVNIKKYDEKFILSSSRENDGFINSLNKTKNFDEFRENFDIYKEARKEKEIDNVSLDSSGASNENEQQNKIDNIQISKKKKNVVFKYNENKKDNKKTIRNKIKPKISTGILDKMKNTFKFLRPFTDIKDKKLSNQLRKYGFNLDNILILINKNAFEKYIDELITSLVNLINSILPEKMKPQKKQGIKMGSNFEYDSVRMKKVQAIQDNDSQKNIIHLGNPNLKLVINIMIGIKNAVSSIGDAPGKEIGLKMPCLFPVDNLGIYEEINRFQYEQNNYDGVIKCKFYDFAPKIFYNLRSLYGILNDDYLKSLGPENFLCNLIITKNKSLKEICSSGKSGSFFYYSYDSKYLMKTIPESEFLKFKDMLQDYYLYICEHPQTLLQRFFGLYMCKFNDIKMHFVVMNNVFNTSLKIHYKYDLKGSTYKRISRKCKEINYDNYDFDIAMKDLDFSDRKEKIDISIYNRRTISSEIHKDSKFLSDHNINDYSLLIGVHDLKFYNKDKFPKGNVMEIFGQKPIDQLKTTIVNNIRKPFYEQYYGGIQSEDKTKVYFFGIIDIFTNYGTSKKVEYIVKTMSQGKGISCKPPDEYSQRFIKYIDKILNVDNDYNFIIGYNAISDNDDKDYDDNWLIVKKI